MTDDSIVYRFVYQKKTGWHQWKHTFSCCWGSIAALVKPVCMPLTSEGVFFRISATILASL